MSSQNPFVNLAEQQHTPESNRPDEVRQQRINQNTYCRSGRGNYQQPSEARCYLEQDICRPQAASSAICRPSEANIGERPYGAQGVINRDVVAPRNEGRNVHRLPIYKWQIEKFNGKEEDLSRFLCLVQQLAQATQTTEEELFENRIHLLGGDVVEHLAEAEDVHTWRDVVRVLTHYGMGTETDSDILRKIFTEKQGTLSAGQYLKRLELWFQSLQIAMTEAEKVKVTLQGLGYPLRQALVSHNYQRWQDLKLAAKKVEGFLGIESKIPRAVTWQTETHKVRNQSEQGERQPNWRQGNPRDWVDRRPVQSERRPFRQEGRPPQVDRSNHQRNGPQRTVGGQSTGKCFECGQPGHWRVNCPGNGRGGSH